MEQVIYLVRHCKATGQDPDCELTSQGYEQSQQLASFFETIEVDQIITSPYTRAVQSILPTAEQKNLDIYVHDGLKERDLSNKKLENWMELLEASFRDLHMKLSGGESSYEAMQRFLPILEAIKLGRVKSTILVTHGNLMTLMLNHFDRQYGFEDWKSLSNPDVYKVTIGSGLIERIWQ
ncbi:histidine phosphatase family protein [Piscibacillus salipiscarius]|uniref:Histidine phosphatase family protein n=1 Tax=Piscibacillus salipiscarius TaxID=299480 RepID=A0ABW5Q7X6_9BACI|nr:histidine phosphatase family protein [Piscibacillus salipiscarius]